MLKRLNRLSKTKDIQAVMKGGRSFYAPVLMLKIKTNKVGLFRVTVVVSTKVSKKATVRNIIKRRIREAMRSLLPEVTADWDAVVLASPKIITPQGKPLTFSEIKKQLMMVTKKAGLL